MCGARVDGSTRALLRRYAARYENAGFMMEPGDAAPRDPSWFMHQVEGDANREATAFLASCLSFGSRSQFIPRIQALVDCAGGDVDGWVRGGLFERDVRCGCGECFYRFFTHGHMNAFLREFRRLMDEHSTLGGFVRARAGGDGFEAVRAICGRFGRCAGAAVVPADAKSACKRVCMFLRWMARDGSPVDLGLWSGFIDKARLVMPLDTHVVRQAARLGLASGAASSMSAARRLTAVMSEVFPGDPLRGDFALFGYGVSLRRTSRPQGGSSVRNVCEKAKGKALEQ